MRFLGMGPGEITLILLALVLLFGANKLPELGRAFARTIKEFKKSMKDINSDDTGNTSEEKSSK